MVTERVGIEVICTTCHKPKAPHGRSVSPVMAPSYCDSGCPGYREDPKPGCLFLGERESEFGYQICSNATREVEAPEDE